ncbi:Threonine dehydratase [Streptomyces hygroscopicus subsp. limoneus]|nr:Threonine dehydratase [Streptomyces hygroscopicus subsp. limoneus]
MSGMTSLDVLTAMDRVRKQVVRTPLLTSAAFDALVGRRVWVKDETKQRTGSFKFRGALYALSTLSKAERAAGVIAGSSGNHAQALALAARLHKAKATVVIPGDAPAAKREAVEALGARVIAYDRRRDRRDYLVHQIAAGSGQTIVPSSDHRAIIAGAGTVAFEMLQEAHDLAAVLVPVGGGGLLAGTALAAAHRSGLRVIGVEPVTANDTQLSLRSGRRTPIPAPDTIADGLRHTEPARLPFEIIRHLVHDIVTVPEGLIAEAMAHLWRYYRTAAEPSGAVALAGLMQAAGRLPDGPIGVVVSGGNTDWPVYRQLLDIGMERTERNLDAPLLH